jgi:hypothetical protein
LRKAEAQATPDIFGITAKAIKALASTECQKACVAAEHDLSWVDATATGN